MAKYKVLVDADLIANFFMNGDVPRMEITNGLPDGVKLHLVDYDFLTGIVTFWFIDNADESYKLIEPIFHTIYDEATG